jgi:type IV secretion system coupling TraD/TrwB family protein
VSQQLGRNKHAGERPNRAPLWTWIVALLALATAVTISAYQVVLLWTPLQRFYAKTYVESGLRSLSGLSNLGTYWMLYVEDQKGTRLALDDEVLPATTESGEKAFRLTDEAAKAGDKRLTFGEVEWSSTELYQFLGHSIYRDETLLDLLRPALYGGLGVFIVGLLVAMPKHRARSREHKEGRRLKGPELVTPRVFNQRNRSDGIGFDLTERTLGQRIFGKTPILRLPVSIEANHILIMGDTGTGKSTLIRRILLQVAERGEMAIVYDPALEYTPEFFSPERGDILLNPLDRRMPYWSPGDELQHPAEALTLATSLFPYRCNESPFLAEAPRKIFAHLLTYRPTSEEMAWWMCHAEEIDRRVRGTQYAAMIEKNVPAQRSSVLASLNMVADSLKLLPSEEEASGRWTAAEWSKQHQGWLFLTSTPETRERLLPLTSLWLDTLVLRLMNQGQTSTRKVWFVLDELATLQRLPQLRTAIIEKRKSNNPVVLVFRGLSQLEARYGHEAEAMLSQPLTKIFLRAGEPNAAEWISRSLGKIEIERLRESRSSGQVGPSRKITSYNNQRDVVPLVTDSEIGGLANFHGYLKSGNLVVRMSFPFIQLPTKQPKYVQRPVEIRPERPPRGTSSAARTDGTPGQELAEHEITTDLERGLAQSHAKREHFFQ